MSDMIRFEDMDKDGHLGLNEFYAAFSKLYSKCIFIIYYKYIYMLLGSLSSNGVYLPIGITEFSLP